MKWWPLLKQFPKYALVVGIIVGSTALFVGWWFFFHSGKRAAATNRPAIDISQQLALIESNSERLLLVDNDLYDLDSGKILFKNWLKNGAPLRLFFDASSKKMIAEYERGFVLYALDGSEEATLAQKTKAAFSDDLKWAVFAREKEVWRADLDWKSFKFTNEKKVTAIEQFYDIHFTENLQLLTGKTLVVRNMNALLRVNLTSGDVHPTRIPLGNIGKRRSPDSKWVVGMMGNQFYCYDVDADDAKPIQVSRNAAMNDFQWLGNNKCLALAGGKAVVIYDRLAHSLTEEAALPFACFKMGEPSPDGRFVFCAGGMGGRDGALVDTLNKTAERITGSAGICWVSNDTFAFSREVPDSDLRGTWLQTAGQAERRISPEPFLVWKGGPQLLALPSAGLVIFATKGGLMKMKPDGTELAELVKLAHPPSRVVGIQKWTAL